MWSISKALPKVHIPSSHEIPIVERENRRYEVYGKQIQRSVQRSGPTASLNFEQEEASFEAFQVLFELLFDRIRE